MTTAHLVICRFRFNVGTSKFGVYHGKAFEFSSLTRKSLVCIRTVSKEFAILITDGSCDVRPAEPEACEWVDNIKAAVKELKLSGAWWDFVMHIMDW